MSIQKPPDARDLRYLELVYGRQRGLSEVEIAKRAGEESPTSLYERIKEDGHPICPKCGSTYVDETHCEVELTEKKGGGRKNRSSGSAKQLPPASNATPLFGEALEVLAQDNEDLRHRKEKLQGGLFHQSDVYTDSVNFRREELPEEQWEFLVETYNLDPNAEGFCDTAKSWWLGGGTPAPQAPLPALIAAYVLTGGGLGPLLRALHPGEPSAEVIEQIRKCIEGKKNQNGAPRDGLNAVAQQLARLVRGGPVRQGRYSADLSGLEARIAYLITDDRKAGISDPEVFEKLRRDPPFALERLTLENELTWAEFCRLRDLNLESPFQ
jgi:hypothetical protein